MASLSPDVDHDSVESEGDEDEVPLVAVPRRSESSVRQSSTDVSTSEAFQLLDKVSTGGDALCSDRLLIVVIDCAATE